MPSVVCPTCGDSSWHVAMTAKEMFAGATFDLAACDGCGLLRTVDPPSHEELATYYDYGAGADAGSRFRPLLEPVMRSLRRQRLRNILSARSRPGRILDVGCGRGVTLQNLANHGWDVCGTELDPAIAASARRALGDRVKIGDVLDLEFDGLFDLVSFWHVLEHLRDPRAALERAVSLLAEGGSILLAVPNRDSWQAQWFGRDWLHLDVPRHLWHFSTETMTRLAENVGLRPVAVEQFSLEYGPFGMFQSALAAAGLGHTLFTRVLRPAKDRPVWREPHAWGHLLLALPLSVAATASLPLEMVAAGVGRGGSIVLRFQHA